jgi:hypothetical protein
LSLLSVQDQAPLQALPSTKMYWLVDHDLDQTLVLDLNQAAIDAIRAAGATSQYIFVEGWFDRVSLTMGAGLLVSKMTFSLVANSVATVFQKDLNQAAIDAIRAAGATSQYIFVEGNAWSGAWSWTGASGTDSVNGSLVKVQDEGLVKVVVLVV